MKITVRDQRLMQELIIKKGFTKSSFGKAIDLSHPMIIQVLNRSRNPSPPVAKRIVDKLNVSFDDIFMIEDEVEE